MHPLHYGLNSFNDDSCILVNCINLICMKRKFIFCALALTVVSSISLLGYRTYELTANKKKIESGIQELPALPFQFFSKHSVASCKYTVISYFSPDCDHCQYMAKQIVIHREDFKNTCILMITPAKLEAAKLFASNYGLENLSFVNVGTDPSFKFYKIFGSTVMPSFYVYGPDKKLLRKYTGETKIQNLITKEN